VKIDDARLLLVTDPRPDLVDRVEAAVRGGVDIVQLRDKKARREELIPLAENSRTPANAPVPCLPSTTT